MKYFISSRGKNSLTYDFLKAVDTLGNDVYTDYETLVNNYEQFNRMIKENTCPKCNNKTVIEGNVDGTVEEKVCPVCHGKKHYLITLITDSQHEDVIFDDDFMERLAVIYVGNPKRIDEYISDECNYVYIKVSDPTSNRGCEYHLTSANMKDVLGLKLTREGKDKYGKKHGRIS